MMQKSNAKYRYPTRAFRPDPADWRIAPVVGLGLSVTTAMDLIGHEVHTAGQLWPLHEAGELAGLGFSPLAVRAIGKALDRIRDRAGDPSPRRWPCSSSTPAAGG